MHQLFTNVSIPYQKLLLVKNYSRNEIIFNEGDLCRYIGLIVKGNVQINTFTYTGNEYTITNLTKDDIFGENLLFTDRPYYLGDVVSLNESQIILIDKSNFIYLMQNDKQFLTNFLTLQANKHLQSQKRIKVLLQKTIRDKIMFYLYDEVKTKNTNIIPIISKENLATLLNIPRPSLSRELIKMKQEKLIDYNRHSIILNDSCLL